MEPVPCRNCQSPLTIANYDNGLGLRCPECKIITEPPLPSGEISVWWFIGMLVVVIGLPVAFAFWSHIAVPVAICVGVPAALYVLLTAWSRATERRRAREYTTRRPLNTCEGCGYTWYPRGSDYARR